MVMELNCCRSMFYGYSAYAVNTGERTKGQNINRNSQNQDDLFSTRDFRLPAQRKGDFLSSQIYAA